MTMTRESIENYIVHLKNKRYRTGVLHVATPEWMQDIKYLIQCVEFLLEEKKDIAS